MEVITEYLKTRKLIDFIQALLDQKVNLVVDVRYSATYPEYFSPKTLREILNKKGIEYFNFQQLGNPPAFRTNKTFVESRTLYSNFIKNNRMKDVEVLVKNIITFKKKACLICYCKTTDPNLCHRFWLLEIMNDVEKRINENVK